MVIIWKIGYKKLKKLGKNKNQNFLKIKNNV